MIVTIVILYFSQILVEKILETLRETVKPCFEVQLQKFLDVFKNVTKKWHKRFFFLVETSVPELN